jgi:hypothetical protein
MSAPATTTVPAAKTQPIIIETEEETEFSTEPYQLVWGFSSLIALIYAERMNAWYPRYIKETHIIYPDTAGNNVSEEWALKTNEIKAWSNASWQMLWLNGIGVFFWGLNLAVG